jgi:hypothetical protein
MGVVVKLHCLGFVTSLKGAGTTEYWPRATYVYSARSNYYPDSCHVLQRLTRLTSVETEQLEILHTDNTVS